MEEGEINAEIAELSDSSTISDSRTLSDCEAEQDTTTEFFDYTQSFNAPASYLEVLIQTTCINLHFMLSCSG